MTALLVLAHLPAGAQEGVVRGRVVDRATGTPLADAQVQVLETEMRVLRQTRTSASGHYHLRDVPPGRQWLRAIVIGHQSVRTLATVPPGGSITVDFALPASAIALDEIVVTGVGAETRRRALGFSVDVLSGDEFDLAPVQSVDQLLQGRVTGATIRATSAQPGTGALINFRGASSAYSAQTPVIYVDGVRVDNALATTYETGGEQSSALADLPASDVERIEVTKGGAHRRSLAPTPPPA